MDQQSPDRPQPEPPREIPVYGVMRLKRFTPADAEVYFDLIDRSRDHLSQHGDVTAQKYPTLESVQDRNDQEKEGEYRFGVWFGETLLGMVKLTEVSATTTEIGYLLGEEFQGSGVMTDSAKAARDFAIKILGYEEVIAWVEEENEQSANVLRKLGFQKQEAKYDQVRSTNGRIYVDELYSYTPPVDV